MISIRKPLYFSEIGRKDTQEDYLFPTEADTSTRVFILCDGMGGHDNGEVASQTAAEALGGFLSEYRRITEERFKEGLSIAYDALDSIDTGSPKKPGTTMTCVAINDNSFLVAHIGDSRIYQIRPSLFNTHTGNGGIILKTEDHSLVNDLLRAGEISQVEAENFPQKNVITRAMQPNLDKRYKADIFIGENIKGGDYFFLCCDGILEQLSEDSLCRILADPMLDDKGKLEAIRNECYGKTRDNFSCWLIPIEEVTLTKQDSLTEVLKAEIEVEDGQPTSSKIDLTSSEIGLIERGEHIYNKSPLIHSLRKRFLKWDFCPKKIFFITAIIFLLVCSAILALYLLLGDSLNKRYESLFQNKTENTHSRRTYKESQSKPNHHSNKNIERELNKNRKIFMDSPK